MIFEALSTMNDENGSDIGAIVNFVEVGSTSLFQLFKQLVHDYLG